MRIGGDRVMSRKRKAPEMTGIFAETANDFVDYKRSLGFKYEGEPKCLARFCRFADEFGTDEIKITRRHSQHQGKTKLPKAVPTG